MSYFSQVSRKAGVVSLAVLMSRVLGFLRDLILAFLFGVGPITSAWIIAFSLPNFLRRLFGEGAFQGALIPIYEESRVQDRKNESERFFSFVLTLSMGAVLLIYFLLLGVDESFKALIRKTGFSEVDRLWQYLVIMFPFGVLICGASLFAGALYGRKTFFSSSLLGFIFNVFMLAVLGYMFLTDRRDLELLSYGVLGSGVLIFIIYFGLYMREVRVWPVPSFRHKRAGAFFILLLPVLIGSGVDQIGLLVDRLLGLVTETDIAGAVAALYFANRILTLPMGLLSYPLSISGLSFFSTWVAEGKTKRVTQGLKEGITTFLFFGLPASVAIIVLAHPLVRVLFSYGLFDESATVITAEALVFYAPSLVFYGLGRVMTSYFYAYKMGFVPLVAGTISVILNIALAIVLIYETNLSYLALPISTSVSAAVYFIIMFLQVILREGGGVLDWKLAVIFFLNIGAFIVFQLALPYLDAWELPGVLIFVISFTLVYSAIGFPFLKRKT